MERVRACVCVCVCVHACGTHIRSGTNLKSFFLKNIFSADYPVEKVTPCQPSPCGANAVCREQNGAGSCSCLPDYKGNPYESCRPECTSNTDCVPTKSCVRFKCEDPCIGLCGQNADCQVIHHSPSCSCRFGYIGDPFTFCRPEPPQQCKDYKRMLRNLIIFYPFFDVKI